MQIIKLYFELSDTKYFELIIRCQVKGNQTVQKTKLSSQIFI